MQTTTNTGGMTAVAFHLGGVYVARMSDDIIVDRWTGTAFEQIALFPCGGNGFPRLRSADGSLWLMYRPQNGAEMFVRNLNTGESRIYPGVFYNWPNALGDAGYAVNSLGTGECVIYNYDGTEAQKLPALPGTGIAYLDGFNRPVSVDDNRGAMGQWGMLNPEYTDGLVCGEGMEGGVGTVYHDEKKLVLATGTFTNVPRIAKNGDKAEWAIVHTDANYQTITLYYGITPADYEAVVEPPIPPVEPPVDPPIPPVDHIITVKPGQRVIIQGVA